MPTIDLAEVDAFVAAARTLVENVTADGDGGIVGKVFVPGHGGLLSNETIRASDHMRKLILAYETKAKTK